MSSLVLIQRENPIAVVRLNRPEVLNALSPELIEELVAALQVCDRDEKIRAIILTGNEKAFAAGADIKTMAGLTSKEIREKNPIGIWDRIAETKKPLIAAVAGFAFGGGCEVALMCDMILASDTAKFGQLEINLGIIPGAGGTQRLTHAIGKWKAMEWILTGGIYSAAEAFAAGLVNKIAPAGELLNEAKKLALKIAEKSPVAAAAAKKAILQSLELPLQAGLKEERRLFYQIFDSQDAQEGMRAFLEKRKPEFKGK